MKSKCHNAEVLDEEGNGYSSSELDYTCVWCNKPCEVIEMEPPAPVSGHREIKLSATYVDPKDPQAEEEIHVDPNDSIDKIIGTYAGGNTQRVQDVMRARIEFYKDQAIRKERERLANLLRKKKPQVLHAGEGNHTEKFGSLMKSDGYFECIELINGGQDEK